MAIICADDKALLRYDHCMTHRENTTTISLSSCSYFELYGYNVSEPGFIDLPDDISELNDYMCRPLNRMGLVCSECIEGYGPSVTSPKFSCSDCTSVWYACGVPLYLLLELVPVTIFYLIVLIFQLNLTSAPMASFIFYSNLVILNLNLLSLRVDNSQILVSIFAISYGIWTLDFFRYAIPPFCVSPKLRITHIYYLQSVSTIFSFVLIAITWLCIKLYSRGYKALTWPWQQLDRLIFKRINVTWNSGSTVVDTFAAFFLLSFIKITVMLLYPLYPIRIRSLNNTDLSTSVKFHSYTDPSVSFFSKEHLPFAAVSTAIFLFVVFPPVLLLALYPAQPFRSLLFKCLPNQSLGPLNIFIQKFYGCYRDSLDSGRDMRSLASLYFFIILIGFMLWSISGGDYFLLAILFGGCSLFIANIQPYKKRYMSVFDSLILGNTALLSVALGFDGHFPGDYYFRIVANISSLVPLLFLYSFIIYKLVNKPLKMVLVRNKPKLLQAKSQLLAICCKGCKRNKKDGEQGNITDNNCDGFQLRDQTMYPKASTRDATY